jgi:SAM-dependent methyltransferase
VSADLAKGDAERLHAGNSTGEPLGSKDANVDENENAKFYEANRARWDESVGIHVVSKGYDMPGFLRGEKSLYPVEIEEMGDVSGKTLLHLQCHFGMDTLSWARLGAKVTGLDFSGRAVEEARRLADHIGVSNATFVQSDLYAAREALAGQQFDIVYTGIGALCWLHDIREWARIVAGFLKPGGVFYIYEGHPALWALDAERKDQQLVITEPYFELGRPSEYPGEYTYVDGPKLKNTGNYEWNHGIGEIVTALIAAGLRLEFLHEHREVAWQALPWMISDDAVASGDESRHQRRATWRLPDEQTDLCPLMYSLRALRPTSTKRATRAGIGQNEHPPS